MTHALPVGANASRSRTVTARDIELFTELTGDRNPLHYDATLAEASRFGGIIVQGGVTSGLLNALVAEDLPGPGSVFLHVDWSFRAPVPSCSLRPWRRWNMAKILSVYLGSKPMPLSWMESSTTCVVANVCPLVR